MFYEFLKIGSKACYLLTTEISRHIFTFPTTLSGNLKCSRFSFKNGKISFFNFFFRNESNIRFLGKPFYNVFLLYVPVEV